MRDLKTCLSVAPVASTLWFAALFFIMDIPKEGGGENEKKLLKNLKKTCSVFIGHSRRVLQISGQKIRLVCYQVYTISYEIVYEIVKQPEVFVVQVVFITVFQVSLRFTRFLLVKTYELTRAFLHFLSSTGYVHVYRRFVDDRLVVIYRNPFLEIMVTILLMYEIGGILGRILASGEVDFDHLDLFILLLFIFYLLWIIYM